MGAGRFFCVALPFGLTIASLVCILVVMSAGLGDKDLEMFQVKTQNLSISTSSLQNLENLRRRSASADDSFSSLTTYAMSSNNKRADHFSALTTAALNGVNSVTGTNSASNITAAELQLPDAYKVFLWNYCNVTSSNTSCSKGKFNWAKKSINTTWIDLVASEAANANVSLPGEVRDALHAFSDVNEFTEIVYILAFIAAIVELVVGCFGFCSKVGSCVTWFFSGISTAMIVAASVMATAESAAVVGTLNNVGKSYSVDSSLNSTFLAITWLAAVFSVAGSVFWAASSCCCGSSSRRDNRRSMGDSEKLVPAPAQMNMYQPVHDTSYPGAGVQQHGVYNPTTPQFQGAFSAPKEHTPMTSGNAYEPYSHANV